MAYGNTDKTGQGTYYHLLVDADGRLIVTDKSEFEVEKDVLANDSDKSFTVPAGEIWELLAARIILASTATVGNRQICIEITDGTDVILRILAGAVQAASLTRYYNFYQGAPNLTAFIDTTHLCNPLPSKLQLAAGYVIRIYDKTAVDAAADDMSVYLTVSKFSQ